MLVRRSASASGNYTRIWTAIGEGRLATTRTSGADDFVRVFRPYRGRHTIQINEKQASLFGDQPDHPWICIHGRLNNRLIASAIAGTTVVGYFSPTSRTTLAVDVDQHDGSAWIDSRPSQRLVAKYRQVTCRLGEPSAVVRSPRGLHVYWVLSCRIPDLQLVRLARARLDGLHVEVRPTHNSSLRIPARNAYLDAVSLVPTTVNLQELALIHPSTLFDDEWLPSATREALRNRDLRPRSTQDSVAIERVEDSVTPIHAGNSNAALNRLIPVYKRRRLSVDDAIERLVLMLERSPDYLGELKQRRDRLVQRLESYYRRPASEFVPEPDDLQPEVFEEAIVADLVRISPFGVQRNEPIRRFLRCLLTWLNWHDSIGRDAARTTWMDSVYPYYRKNRREGFYPLPSSKLRQWNDRYNQLMDWLQHVEFLAPAPYPYVPVQGVCKYYDVNRALFGVEHAYQPLLADRQAA